MLPTISAISVHRRPLPSTGGSVRPLEIDPRVLEQPRQVQVEQREDQRDPAEHRHRDGERERGEVAEGAAGGEPPTRKAMASATLTASAPPSAIFSVIQ